MRLRGQVHRNTGFLALTLSVGDIPSVQTRLRLMERLSLSPRAHVRLAILLAVLHVGVIANAQDVVRLDGSSEIVRLGSELVAVYPDKGLSSFAEVRALPASSFETGHERRRCFGFQARPYWARFVSVEETEGKEWLLEIPEKSLDSLTVFTRGADGTYTRWDTGDMLPFGSREVRNRNFVFTLGHSGLGPDTTYVRVATTGPMCLPVNAYSPVGFYQVERRRQFFIGGFFGIVVVMLLFNLIIWLMLRDKAYGVYVFYVSSFFLYQVSVERLGFEYLWPNAPGWEQLSYGVFALLTTGFTVQFARVFLKTIKLWLRDDVGPASGSIDNSALGYLRRVRKEKKLGFRKWFRARAPIDRILLVAIGLCVPLLFFHLLADRQVANYTLIFFVFVVTVFLTYVAIESIRNKHVAAKHYFAAWVFFFTATMISMMGYLSVLPLGNLRLRVVQFGSVCQLTLLALALGFRLKLAREEAARQRSERAAEWRSAERRAALIGPVLHAEAGHYVGIVERFLTRLRKSNSAHSKDDLNEALLAAESLHDLIRRFGRTWQERSASLLELKNEIVDALFDRFDGSEVSRSIYLGEPRSKKADATDAAAAAAAARQEELEQTMLPPEVAFVARHMIMEIGENTRRHAKATELSLVMDVSKDHTLLISMWDDGVGMTKDSSVDDGDAGTVRNGDNGTGVSDIYRFAETVNGAAKIVDPLEFIEQLGDEIDADLKAELRNGRRAVWWEIELPLS